jgi:hypothetical protein
MMLRIAPWVLVLLLGLTAAWLWRERSGAKAEAGRVAEAAKLAAAGQIVAAPVVDLQPELDKLTDENTTLRTALADARKLVPGAKIDQVEHAQTAPQVVTAAPEAGAVQGRCVVDQGDKLELRVDQVELRTRAGNVVLVGSASAWRTDPPPEVQLVAGKFEQTATTLSDLATKQAPSWGFGVAEFAGSYGWASGAAVLAPPLMVLGHELDLGLSAGIGTLGFVGSASVVVRP